MPWFPTLALLMTAAIAPSAASAQREGEGPRVEVSVDVNTVHQTIEGFGASGAWWPTWVGDYPRDKQDQLLDLLFSPDKGIALSIFRYNLPAGSSEATVKRPERRTVQIETSPGEYDLSRDDAALDLLAGARERGVQRFVLFSNSPPERMTVSGKASGGPGGGSNLRPDMVEAFATYVLDVAERVRERCDLPDDGVAVSPINEPQWRWGGDGRGQEGSHYKPAEVAAVIREVIEQNEQRGLGFEIEAPESGAWEPTMPYAKALFDDPIIDEHLDALAIHSYWTNAEQRRKAAEALRAAYPDKRIAMTEYCEMRHGHDLSIEGGLHMAGVIHEDLTVGNVVSWQWWLAVAAGGYRDGLIYADPETQVIEVTKRLWVLGQWSRFVRPGFERVAAEASDDRLKATAFRSGDGRRLVIVTINPTDQPIPVAFTALSFAVADAFVTDADRDLAATSADTPLPPKSVTTLILVRE